LERPEFLANAVLELSLAHCLIAAILKDFKYRELDTETALAFADVWPLLAFSVGAVAAIVALPVWAWLPLACLVAGVVWSVSLEALIFRTFTVQMSPAGVRPVLPLLLRGGMPEVSQTWTGVLSHKVVALIPVSTSVVHLEVLYGGQLLTQSPFLLLFVAHGIMLVHRVRPTARPAPYGVLAALALGACVRYVSPQTHAHLAGALMASMALMGVLALAHRRFRPGGATCQPPSFLATLTSGRRLPDTRGMRPRPEHVRLHSLTRHIPSPSSVHGRLRGADVVMITLESVGRDHLELLRSQGAITPFLENLLAHSLHSLNHFCISPNTNNAHDALYASAYPGATRSAFTKALRRARYQVIYMSAARTENYGLRDLLADVDFEHVVDATAFASFNGASSAISDYVLLDAGIAKLLELRTPSTRLFLHVQTVNTHVPYRVVDRQRFDGRRASGEFGRFLASVEETVWLVAELLRRLEAAGITTDPLIVMTSDHGQAFGEFGYRCHSNAVVKGEINVPFYLHHSSLASRVVDYSTHFDVLPTILDLVGLDSATPVFGESLFNRQGEPAALLFAEAARAGVPSHFGLLIGRQKLMLDLVLGRYYEMDWNDEAVRSLGREEQEYYLALVHSVGSRVGLL
jgi:hypothetical protein